MKKFEMSEEQKSLFDALTTLQQQISLNSLSGMNDINAYKASDGKAKTVKAMEASVCQILGHHRVVAFMESMKSDMVSDAIMTRERMLELQTKIADIGNIELEAIDLGSLNELKGALDIKLKAMNQIAEMQGYKSAAKFDHTSSDGSMTNKPTIIKLVAPSE